jgi:histidinol-phosphate aminotransferase
VVVDEAYVEFAEIPSTAELEPRPPNLVVVRSLSKAWGLAGARVGYAIAAAEVAAELEATQLPGAVSALTQAVAIAALREGEAEHRARLAAVHRERERLRAALAAIPGVEVWPSSANFVLFRTPRPVDELLGQCERQGVLIRDVSEQRGLERCARATIATPEASDRLLGAVAVACGRDERSVPR